MRSEAHRAHHCLELDGATIIPSWESPDRADRVDAATDQAGFTSVIEPEPLDRSIVHAVHDADYVSFLESAFDRWARQGHTAPAAMAFGWPTRRFRPVRPDGIEAQLGFYSFAADCSIAEHTWTAAAESAATADTTAKRVSGGERVAFGRCRPPGHHAMRDQFGGYCYLNNAAIAATRLRIEGAERVAILDVDYHHGNGTQDIFYDRNDVAFCSLHADPDVEFPYFLGHADETGEGRGVGANLNLPLPHGTEAAAWFEALDRGLEWIGDFRPDAVVVSLGVDTFVDDPISHFRLDTADYPILGARLAGLELPTVILLEGGYATEALGANVVGVLAGYRDS